MYVNQEHGWKDVIVFYNIPKVNKEMSNIDLKESRFNTIYKEYLSTLNETKELEDDGFDKFRKMDLGFDVDDFLAKMGLGKKYKPTPRKTEECPECGKKNAYHKEIHPDTSMNDIVLYCPDCKYRK